MRFAPDKDNPLYDSPPAPDKDNPLYDSPKRPDMPRQTLDPRQVRNQAIAAAKDTRQQAMQAARAMQDRGQRLSAKQAALDAYANARNAAQQQYRASRTGISSPGGPTGGDMLQPPRPTFDTTMSDDFKPRQKSQTSFLDRVKQSGMMKKGGSVKKYKAGGSVKPSKMGGVKTASPKMSSASKRADGIAMKGKTRGRIV